MYDPALKGKYSKRVRSKMSVDQIHKALARFASKPFPEDMSGEDIAKVVNGMKLYHVGILAVNDAALVYVWSGIGHFNWHISSF